MPTNHFLLLNKFKNTESAQLWTLVIWGVKRPAGVVHTMEAQNVCACVCVCVCVCNPNCRGWRQGRAGSGLYFPLAWSEIRRIAQEADSPVLWGAARGEPELPDFFWHGETICQIFHFWRRHLYFLALKNNQKHQILTKKDQKKPNLLKRFTKKTKTIKVLKKTQIFKFWSEKNQSGYSGGEQQRQQQLSAWAEGSGVCVCMCVCQCIVMWLSVPVYTLWA